MIYQSCNYFTYNFADLDLHDVHVLFQGHVHLLCLDPDHALMKSLLWKESRRGGTTPLLDLQDTGMVYILESI